MTKIKLLLMSLIVALSVVFVLPTKQTEAQELEVSWSGTQTGNDIFVYSPGVAGPAGVLSIENIAISYQYFEENKQYLVTNVYFEVIFRTDGRPIPTRKDIINEPVNVLIMPRDYLDYDMKYFGLNLFGDHGEMYISVVITDNLYTNRNTIFDYEWYAEELEEEEFYMFDTEINSVFDKDLMYYSQVKDYQQGYYDGLKQGEKVNDDYYADGIQTGYTSGYTDGYSDAEDLFRDPQNYGFLGLFTGIADTPYLILTSLLSFDVFGMSAFSILFGILTILIIAWLIKKFMV